jgi:copper chaperone
MVKLKVTGMSCNHCVIAVTKALKAVHDVKDVTVDLHKGQAIVEGGAKPLDLIEAIIDEGYQAEALTE